MSISFVLVLAWPTIFTIASFSFASLSTFIIFLYLLLKTWARVKIYCCYFKLNFIFEFKLLRHFPLAFHLSCFLFSILLSSCNGELNSSFNGELNSSFNGELNSDSIFLSSEILFTSTFSTSTLSKTSSETFSSSKFDSSLTISSCGSVSLFSEISYFFAFISFGCFSLRWKYFFRFFVLLLLLNTELT